MDLVGGLAQFAAEREEVVELGGVAVASVGLGLEGGGEGELEGGEGGEQGVVGGLAGDVVPVLFEQAEVCLDGGGVGLEVGGDVLGGGASLAEVVGVEDALALLWGDGGGTHVLYWTLVGWVLSNWGGVLGVALGGGWRGGEIPAFAGMTEF